MNTFPSLSPLVDTRLRSVCDWVRTPFIQELQRRQLPENYLTLLETVFAPMAYWLSEQRLQQQKLTFIVGVNGAQGAGKSTLCHFLALTLRHGFGLNTVGFSLDDIYLSKAARRGLAKNQHPLLKTRGVPGTHDVALGLELLSRLKHLVNEESTYLPCFDKSTDDRAPLEQWPVCQGPVDIVLFEGWCVGTPSQSHAALSLPINELELNYDLDGSWRCYVNDQLAGPYQTLFKQLDTLIMLQIPGWDYAQKWRRVQEQMLKKRYPFSPDIMSEEQLNHFIQHYQRLTEHSLHTVPQLADICLKLNRQQQIHDVWLPPLSRL